MRPSHARHPSPKTQRMLGIGEGGLVIGDENAPDEVLEKGIQAGLQVRTGHDGPLYGTQR